MVLMIINNILNNSFIDEKHILEFEYSLFDWQIVIPDAMTYHELPLSERVVALQTMDILRA